MLLHFGILLELVQIQEEALLEIRLEPPHITGIRTRLLVEPEPGPRSEIAWQLPSNEGVTKLCGAMKENRLVTSLDLSSCGVEIEAARALSASLPPRLGKLALGSNPLGVPGIDVLGTTLQGNRRLRELSLDLVQCSGRKGGRSLAGLLSGMTNLRGLALQMNDLGDDGVVELAEGVRTLRALTAIDLSSNGIADAGALALAEALNSFGRLLRANFHENRLGATGATAMARSLYSCISLQHLDLGSNRLLDKGAVAVSKALSDCPELKFLDLSENGVGAKSRAAVAASLGREGRELVT